MLVLGWLAQAGLRLWLAAEQTSPTANPDETGYLIAARILSGGPNADLSYSTVYHGGYPLLLAPAYWLSHDPETVYRLCMVVNALVGAALLPLAFRAALDLRLTKRWSYAAAHVTALLPGASFYGLYVLTDAVLPVVFLGWILLLYRWIRDERMVYAAGASMVAAYACAVHSRGTVLLVVQACTVLVMLFRGRAGLRSSAAAATVLAAGVYGATLLSDWLMPQMYPLGDNNLEDNLVWRLTHAEGHRWTLALTAGQLWYQIVATAGIAGLGLTALVAIAVRRGTPFPLRWSALAVLAAVAGVAVATSAALPDEQRAGNFVTGRYLACLLPVLFLTGLAALVRARRTELVQGAVIALGLALALGWTVLDYADDRLRTGKYIAFDFLEMNLLTGDWERFHLWRATVVALGLFGAVLFLVRGAGMLSRKWPGRSRGWSSRVHRVGAPLAVALLAALNLAVLTTSSYRIARPPARDAADVAGIGRLGDAGTYRAVAIDQGVTWGLRVPLLYQVWWTKVIDFNAASTRPPGQADLVVLRWRASTAPASTWPDAPPGFRIVDTRSSYADGVAQGWVAWARS
ncbi:hypothetical protein [Actinomadura litoris]|uniref:hypothetical protein n=1 Tax=Actinomadura litoris TaxID=2678616 RepID=UPI001FA75138|nr:hypothetical protein [Actinomadura litoris]